MTSIYQASDQVNFLHLSGSRFSYMQIKEAGLKAYHSVHYPSYGHSVEYLLKVRRNIWKARLTDQVTAIY